MILRDCSFYWEMWWIWLLSSWKPINSPSIPDGCCYSVSKWCQTQPHGLQHARPPRPSPTPGVHPNHVHWVSDAIQSSHPVSSPSPLPSIFPSIRVFSNESAFCISWPKYWSFSFSISPCNESVQFSCSIMSDSLWPHGLQHARLTCPLLSPGVCSNSCPLSWWCRPTISSSVASFSSCHNLSQHQSLVYIVGVNIFYRY